MDALVRWDAKRLIKDLGGPTFVRAHLLAHGLEIPSGKTIANWAYRDRLPGNAAALLLVLGRRLSSTFNPFDYLLVEDESGERPA